MLAGVADQTLRLDVRRGGGGSFRVTGQLDLQRALRQRDQMLAADDLLDLGDAPLMVGKNGLARPLGLLQLADYSRNPFPLSPLSRATAGASAIISFWISLKEACAIAANSAGGISIPTCSRRKAYNSGESVRARARISFSMKACYAATCCFRRA